MKEEKKNQKQSGTEVPAMTSDYESIRKSLIEKEILPMKCQLQQAIDALQPEGRRMLIPSVHEVMQHLCPGVDEKTAWIFVNTARSYGLNPFKREIYLIPFRNKETGKRDWSIVVGYQVYVMRARKDRNYMFFKADLIGDKKNPTGAWCEIYRKDWGDQPFRWEIDRKEFDKEQSLWKTKLKFMLLKTVIGQAHRLVYPEEFAGMPEPDLRIINAEGVEISEEPSKLGKADSGFFGESTEEAAGAEDKSAERQIEHKALKPQLTALQRLFENPDLPNDIGNELAQALDAHDTGESVMTGTQASELISKCQQAIFQAKNEKKKKQEELQV